MVPAGNKAKRLSSVNHITKTIHHHQTSRKNIKISGSFCITQETMAPLSMLIFAGLIV